MATTITCDRCKEAVLTDNKIHVSGLWGAAKSTQQYDLCITCKKELTDWLKPINPRGQIQKPA